jgi:type IV secretory pathway VirJ component
MPRKKRYGRWALGVLGTVSIGLAAFAWSAGFLDRDPRWFFGVGGKRPPYVAVLFSGDMGLRYGMGSYIAAALQKKGVPVLGLSSPAAFGSHKSRAEVDAFVAQAVRDAMRRTGAPRVLLMGQSFGADIARVGLAHFPPDLRPNVAAAVLVVPGSDAFFRADPSGLAYRAAPDAGPEEARAIDWLPVLCVKGSRETDSLCPALTRPNVRTVVLPGGHFLQRDHERLTATIMASLDKMLGPPWR